MNENCEPGSDTIRLPLKNEPRVASREAHATVLLGLGIILLLLDGCGLAHFADSIPEAFIFAALTMPAGIFVVICALEARK